MSGGRWVVIDFDADGSVLPYGSLSRLVSETERAIGEKSSMEILIFDERDEGPEVAVLQRARQLALWSLILSVERDGQRMSPDQVSITSVERPPYIVSGRAIVEVKSGSVYREDN